MELSEPPGCLAGGGRGSYSVRKSKCRDPEAELCLVLFSSLLFCSVEPQRGPSGWSEVARRRRLGLRGREVPGPDYAELLSQCHDWLSSGVNLKWGHEKKKIIKAVIRIKT